MESLIPDTPDSIVIPKADARIYRALLIAHRDMKAAERVKELLEEKPLCDDCLDAMEVLIERKDAVAKALAELLNLRCPRCSKRLHCHSPLASYEIADGKCHRCGAPIVLEE